MFQVKIILRLVAGRHKIRLQFFIINCVFGLSYQNESFESFPQKPRFCSLVVEIGITVLG